MLPADAFSEGTIIMTEATYPVRLPLSIKREAERLAVTHGLDLDGFVARAVAEKVAALQGNDFFRERRERADLPAFDRLMARPGGEPPRPGDELPDDWQR